MRLVEQRYDGDCGLACLASYLRLKYEDAYAAALGVNPNIKRRGAFSSELVAIAALLGFTLVMKRRPNLEKDCGILGLNRRKRSKKTGRWISDPKQNGHWVVLRRGQILDVHPPAVFDIDEYLETNEMVTGAMLTVAE
jgi:ABC-type bacteriocin/lantibiotic exporter with double-glycine peptidase domain